MYDTTVTKFFSIDAKRLFDYFTQAELLEKWSAPEGMTLKIPVFEARPGGRYRYEHTSKDGVYVCEGFVKEIIPEKKLVQQDEYIKSPKGEELGKNLECTIDFESMPGGTEVRIETTGFDKKEFADECETGWTQCLDKLSDLISNEVGFKTDRNARSIKNLNTNL